MNVVIPSTHWYKGCGFDSRVVSGCCGKPWKYCRIFWTKHDICITQKHMCDEWDLWKNFHMFHLALDLTTCRSKSKVIINELYDIFCGRSHFENVELNLGYSHLRSVIDQNDSFRYFRLLMSTWRDSICENTFETSHVRFIHENFSVLITALLDQIQQNLLRKETCQTTANPADILFDVIWRIPNPTLRTPIYATPAGPRLPKTRKGPAVETPEISDATLKGPGNPQGPEHLGIALKGWRPTDSNCELRKRNQTTQRNNRAPHQPISILHSQSHLKKNIPIPTHAPHVCMRIQSPWLHTIRPCYTLPHSVPLIK